MANIDEPNLTTFKTYLGHHSLLGPTGLKLIDYHFPLGIVTVLVLEHCPLGIIRILVGSLSTWDCYFLVLVGSLSYLRLLQY